MLNLKNANNCIKFISNFNDCPPIYCYKIVNNLAQLIYKRKKIKGKGTDILVLEHNLQEATATWDCHIL